MEREQVPHEVVEVLLGQPAIEPPRHRVGIAGHDVRTGVADGLDEVVLGARAWLPRLGGTADVGEGGPDRAAGRSDLVAAPAVLLLVHLPAPPDRIGRPRLDAAADDEDREREPEKPHHPRVNSTAALRGATVVLGDRAILRAFDLEIASGGHRRARPERHRQDDAAARARRSRAAQPRDARGRRRARCISASAPGLLHGVSARDNLRFLASFRGVPVDAVGPALASWGLASKDATRPVETLSAGQRRRAALARIDVERCELVLLDEPFGEIDDDAAAQLLRTIRRLAGERRSVVIATHGRFELDAGANEVVRLA